MPLVPCFLLLVKSILLLVLWPLLQYVNGKLIFLLGLTVVAVFHQVLGKVNMRLGIVLFVANHVAVGCYGSLALTDVVVAHGHLSCSLASQVALLGWCALIGSAILVGCIVVFA